MSLSATRKHGFNITRLEIFVPILAKFSVPSFQSLISSSIARSFGSHFRSRVLVRIWPFAEEWVLGEFSPLKNKFLQALSFLLICDLHAFTSFFCKIFPCTFTLCFMHTEFAVLQVKIEYFCRKFSRWETYYCQVCYRKQKT